jgi:hypothetical protein
VLCSDVTIAKPCCWRAQDEGTAVPAMAAAPESSAEESSDEEEAPVQWPLHLQQTKLSVVDRAIAEHSSLDSWIDPGTLMLITCADALVQCHLQAPAPKPKPAPLPTPVTPISDIKKKKKRKQVGALKCVYILYCMVFAALDVPSELPHQPTTPGLVTFARLVALT